MKDPNTEKRNELIAKLYREEGLTSTVIAKRVGMSPSAVRKIIRRSIDGERKTTGRRRHGP